MKRAEMIKTIDTVFEKWLTDGSDEQTLGEAIADELQAKEISDEEIETESEKHAMFKGFSGKTNINIAKQVSFMQGAKWYREQIK